jgi:16S rRNA (guanine966-N2)-methyltransferase
MKEPNDDFIEFSVISGELKGRKIVAPDLGVTRPPLSRVRKSIFDFLMPYIVDARYLDLFSGTGAYLFEAVSRGAVKAVGVELEPLLTGSINLQAKKFRVDDRLTCLTKDVMLAIPELHAKADQFDIIMMAPPQYKGIVTQTLEILRANPVSSAEGIILCQHDTSETNKIQFFDFRILQQRKYGNTTFSVLRPVK